MISISAVVAIVLSLVVAGLIFGLLFYAVCYCEREFPGAAPFWKFTRILLVLLAVFVLIGILLQLVIDRPLFRP